MIMDKDLFNPLILKILRVLIIFLIIYPLLLYCDIEGEQITNNVIRITNIDDLQNIKNDLSGHYELTNDINASITDIWNDGSGFLPIGNKTQMFTGILDGNGFKIKNLYINRSSDDFIGLMAYMGDGAYIKNIDLIDINISGKKYVGGIVGYSLESRIENSSVSGSVEGYNFVGGISGYGYECNFNYSIFSGDVRGYQNIGGIAGDIARSEINYCYAPIKAEGTMEMGGLVGLLEENSKIKYSYAISNITGLVNIGGIVGKSTSGIQISDSYSVGNVCGFDYVGGLVGHCGSKQTIISNSHFSGNVNGSTAVGGLIGLSSGGTVSNSYTRCNVQGIINVGGLIGTNGMIISESYSIVDVKCDEYGGSMAGLNFGPIINSYSRGNISGNSTIGGFIGSNLGSVSFSYSTGNVNGKIQVGGMIGSNSGTVSNCFWNTETSGQIMSDGGTGKTTSEMMKKQTYTDSTWDFTDTWFIIEDVTYPFLRWQEMSPPIANAGADQSIEEGSFAIFDGSASHDDVGIINYTWTFYDLGIHISLYGLKPVYLFMTPGIYSISLRVTDYFNKKGIDTMNLTVFDTHEPVADAGEDLVIDEDILFVFDGRKCYDPYYPGRGEYLYNGINNFTWIIFNRNDNVTLYGLHPSYIFEEPGVYSCILNVTDGAGNWAKDTFSITVRDITDPMSDAGEDIAIINGEIAQFNGSLCSDNGIIMYYNWTFEYNGTVETVQGKEASFKFVIPGIYPVTLRIEDAFANYAEDALNVTVLDTIAPRAKIMGKTQILDGESMVLSGLNSTDNGKITRYVWTFIDDEPMTMEGPSITFMFKVVGLHEIVLTVYDEWNNSATTNVTVIVVDITSPIADAGPDLTVVKGTDVVLDGSNSNDNHMITDWVWSWDYNGSNIAIHGEVVDFVFAHVGNYTVTLKVTDAEGNTGTDTVIINVEDEEEIYVYTGPEDKDLFLWWIALVIIFILILSLLGFIYVRHNRNSKRSVHNEYGSASEE